uniref:Uncharacterized protein n=1 Tax=Myoviridae sp. ctp7F23 TaxID=2825174 RepID=A0A8S5U8M7_9CAUD|nr:MAG TPA: hypothetical protein [Myoviridae sp. ctp7F23]
MADRFFNRLGEPVTDYRTQPSLESIIKPFR